MSVNVFSRAKRAKNLVWELSENSHKRARRAKLDRCQLQLATVQVVVKSDKSLQHIILPGISEDSKL